MRDSAGLSPDFANSAAAGGYVARRAGRLRGRADGVKPGGRYGRPVRRSVGRCPNCGEPVSQFAAGCAICGFDLEAHRSQLAARRASAPHVVAAARLPGWLRRAPLGLDRFRGDVHVTRLVFAIVITLLAPVLGLFLAAFFAYHADQDGRDWIRNALIAVCGFAFAMLYLAPFSIWGLLLS